MDSADVIRVLGPIDVLTPKGAVAIGSRGARVVLGSLVVAAGHTVAWCSLVEALWGDAPPPSALDSLHSKVSRLRAVLGHDTIECADHTYRLLVPREAIDALRFEDLLAEAGEHRDAPLECLRICRQALALWRGEPFGDLADCEPFRLEAMRLDELRVVAMEFALEAEIALGRWQLAAAELEMAVREYPYRERLWYLLIDALTLDDRRVEALRACQQLRAVLADVGLVPGQELVSLEDRVLLGEGAGVAGSSNQNVVGPPGGDSTP